METLAMVAAHRWGGGAAETTKDASDGIVECPNCGAGNEVGYRYCRDYVSELPGAQAVDRSTSTPLDGFVR